MGTHQLLRSGQTNPICNSTPGQDAVKHGRGAAEEQLANVRNVIRR